LFKSSTSAQFTDATVTKLLHQCWLCNVNIDWRQARVVIYMSLLACFRCFCSHFVVYSTW